MGNPNAFTIAKLIEKMHGQQATKGYESQRRFLGR